VALRGIRLVDLVSVEVDVDTADGSGRRTLVLRNHEPSSSSPPGSGMEAAIRLVHDGLYVDALATGQPQSLAQSQGFVWDPGLWRAVRASTAGVLSAVDSVLEADARTDVGAAAGAAAGAAPHVATGGPARLSGSLSSGMHHAKHATGDGYCTVNALVVAAAHAVARYDVDVTVLDIDAHAGGGTDELLRLHGETLGLTRVRHLDLTTRPYDSYAALTLRSGDVNIEDVTLDGDDDAYLAAVDALLRELPTGPGHLVLHNAGMDPHMGSRSTRSLSANAGSQRRSTCASPPARSCSPVVTRGRRARTGSRLRTPLRSRRAQPSWRASRADGPPDALLPTLARATQMRQRHV